MMKRKVLLGVVGVDSGQLLVCDPSYLASEWQRDTDPPGQDNTRPVYRDTEDGSLWQCTALESGTRDPGIKSFLVYDFKLDEYGGMTPNELRETGRWIEQEMPPLPCRGRFSYNGCCEATLNNPNHGGQLNYLMGHEGAGVVFSSGFGDGEYEVWATLWEDPEDPNHTRIASIEIVMISEEEDEG